MKTIFAPLLWFALSTPTGLQGPVPFADSLLSGLELSGHKYTSQEQLSIALELPPELEGWRDPLKARLRASLLPRGFGRVHFAFTRGPLERAGAQYIQEGSEWLLSVKLNAKSNEISGFAHFYRLDSGLWDETANIRLVSSARSIQSRPEVEPPPPILVGPPPPPPEPEKPKPSKLSRAQLQGPPMLLLRMPETILAMALCPLAGDTLGLLVLQKHRLQLFKLEENGYTQHLHSLSLSDLPSRRARVRIPMGTILCGENSGAFYFGSSELSAGYQAQIEGQKLSLVRPLAGMPVAQNQEDIYLAIPASGTNLFGSQLTVQGPEQLNTVNIERALYQIQGLSKEGGIQFWGISEKLQLLRWKPGQTPESLGPAGLGLSLRGFAEGPVWVVSATDGTPQQDTLYFHYQGQESSVKVPGAVQNTALAPLGKNKIVVLAALQTPQKSSQQIVMYTAQLKMEVQP